MREFERKNAEFLRITFVITRVTFRAGSFLEDFVLKIAFKQSNKTKLKSV